MMMKKGIYAFLAVLTVFAMILAGCPDGDKNTGDTKTKFTLNPPSLELEVGNSKLITPTPPLLAIELDWSSSDELVATVNPGGSVRGYTVGTAIITAEAKDGGKATCTVTVIPAVTPVTDVEVKDGTLLHHSAKLVGVGHFGSQLGTTNDDGSYTFDGTAGEWSGGGAQYDFPAAKQNDTWKLGDYDVVEMTLKITGGSVRVKSAKSGGNTDLMPYPSGSQYFTLDSSANGGVYICKYLITDAGSGVGFQRQSSGPATVKIEKVVFSKIGEHTVTFDLGGASTVIPPVKVLTDTKVTLPYRPKWDGHTFTGWYDGATLFDPDTLITKDYTLTAHWTNVAPVPTDMSLNLDPANWGTLPPNGALTGGSPSYTIPSEYAETTFEDGKLIIKFDGRNRQRAIIPLTPEQIYELQDPDLRGATTNIVATVAKGANGGGLIGSDGSNKPADSIIIDGLHFAGFRVHLGNPSASSNWNGTNTNSDKEIPITEHLTELLTFSTNRSTATLGWFIIQAMFRDKDESNGSIKEGFPEVIITVESITLEPTPNN
jgi:uncharacterized repeat protein (TIGR02543 family)